MIFDDGWHYRDFLIYQITKEQEEDELYWHALFQKHVGTHTDYCMNKEIPIATGSLAPEGSWKDFFDPYKNRKPPLYKEEQIIGWFRIGEPKTNSSSDDDDDVVDNNKL